LRVGASLFILMLGDVSHNIFDRIGFAKVARGVAALVDNCAVSTPSDKGEPSRLLTIPSQPSLHASRNTIARAPTFRPPGPVKL
jgi:hypothetical protein